MGLKNFIGEHQKRTEKGQDNTADKAADHHTVHLNFFID